MENLSMENTRNTDNEMNSSNVSMLTEKSDQNSQVDVEPIELAEHESQQYEEPKTKLTKLPIGRIRTIIKTDPDISLINQEAIFLVTKATELFIDSLSKESYKHTYQTKKRTIQKNDVQSVINNVDPLMFLDGILL